MEIVIAVVALVLLIAALGAAPMTRRFGDASEEKLKASMPGNLRADVESGFKRPRDQGDLF